jgi:integrase
VKKPKRTKNIIHLKNGKLEASFHWPDGKRFRKRIPDEKTGDDLIVKADHEIKFGDWRALREKWNDRGKKAVVISEKDISIPQCVPLFLQNWCRSRHDSDFYERELKNVERILHDKRLQSFTRQDGNYFYDTRLLEVATTGPRKGQQITTETANHGLTALSAMLRWAHEEMGWIPAHPMKDFQWKEPKKKVRFPVDGLQVRNLVEEAIARDEVVGKCFGIVSQTALRIGQGIELKRPLFDVRRGLVIVEPFKANKDGYSIPISPEAMEYAKGLPRAPVGSGLEQYLFVRQDARVHSGRKWGMLERTYVCKIFEEARIAAGIEAKITPHDLRHFRAIEWLEIGWDIDKVREWMGHTSLLTTKRYLKYCQDRVMAAAGEMYQREQQRLERLKSAAEKEA